MKIIKIEWRNIFSYGNKIQTLDFGSEGKVWQLSGVSGSGKSSLLNIPKVLFFGKAESCDGKPITATNIANWINKKGWIRGEVQNNGNTYIIERTFSPQSLSIYRNGENLEVAGAKNMQAIIESEILDGIPYHIFSSLMTLSLSGGKSFISMTPADKREIIDRIFSLEIINKVNEYIKKDKKELGNTLNSLSTQIFALSNTIKLSTDKLNKLIEESKTSNTNEIAVLNSKIEKLNELMKTLQSGYDELKNKRTEIINGKNALNTALIKKSGEKNDIVRQLNLFNQEKCPTCGSSFNSSEFMHIKEILNSDLALKESEYAEIKKQYDMICNAEAELNTSILNAEANIAKVNTKKYEINAEIQGINKMAERQGESEAIRQIITETEDNKKDAESSVENISHEMTLLNYIEGMYSSDGIKKYIMDKYIPMLNQDIADTLVSLSFPYSLEFDSNFDPTIKFVGQPITSANLSMGEHKKIDVTVLCALLKFLKRRYPQLNVVCLDETVSSLDYESSTNVIKRIKKIAEEMGMHIFIVSHTQLNEELFDKHINITKNLGFSEISYI